MLIGKKKGATTNFIHLIELTMIRKKRLYWEAGGHKKAQAWGLENAIKREWLERSNNKAREEKVIFYPYTQGNV